MKPTRIAFTKKYFPEQYHGEDYFIEYILEEGDTLDSAFKQAKEETFRQFKNNNPQIQWNNEVVQVNGNDLPAQQAQANKGFIKSVNNKAFFSEPLNYNNKELETTWQDEIPPPPKKSIEEQIEECTSLEELQTFKIIAVMNEKLQRVYSLKYTALTGVAHTFASNEEIKK